MIAEISPVTLSKIEVKSISPTSSVSEPSPADQKEKDFFAILTEVFTEKLEELTFDPELGVFLPNKLLV